VSVRGAKAPRSAVDVEPVADAVHGAQQQGRRGIDFALLLPLPAPTRTRRFREALARVATSAADFSSPGNGALRLPFR